MTDYPHSLGVSALARAYRRGELRALEVTEALLERLCPGPVYRLVTAERALAQARRADALFAAGQDHGPLQGVPLALKDLMDTRGDVTAAGSKVLAEGAPARADCLVAARLDEVGAVFLGKTTMTELAFSGLGLNPHFGTPANVFDAARLPGGSSSGSAVAVASGLAAAAVGSDTGGSVRIPAAFNGLVGLKTTDGALPMEGVTPLSLTLDTLGPVARSAEDAWALWRAMAGLPPAPLPQAEPKGLAVALPQALLHDALEPEVARRFAEACAGLEALGARLMPREGALLREIPELTTRYGSFAGHEALALYEKMIDSRADDIDPRVRTRIVQVRDRPAKDYIRLGIARRSLQTRFWEEFAWADIIAAPTVAILPPTLEAVQDDEAYYRLNTLVLRNTAVFNFLGAPAISLPCGLSADGLPVGLMLAARPGQEALLLALGDAFEKAMKPPGPRVEPRDRR